MGARDDDVAWVVGGPATLEDGTPVPGTELAVAMCDCEITRLVIDAEGAPLDLGRAERVFTGQQRRAVIARDRECAWPECHAHARWCQIHHIRWWERDTGRTSVDNGVLLCSYHHHEVHRRDLAIARVPLPRPDGEPPGAGLGGTIAQVAYEFRDQTGRIAVPMLAARPDVARSGAAARQVSERHSLGESKPAQNTTRPRNPPVSNSPPEPDRVDELDLELATDPVTGMRVLACFLTT